MIAAKVPFPNRAVSTYSYAESPGQFPAFPVALQAPTEAGSYILTLRLNCLAVTYIGDPIVIPVTVSREVSVPQTVP